MPVAARALATRIDRLLEKRGLVERDSENAWLSADAIGSGLSTGVEH